MAKADRSTFGDWIAAQTPGRRLWLFLGGIAVVLGGLSLAGPSPQSTAVAQGTHKPAKQVADGPSGPIEPSVPPGAQGKPVKTVAVMRAVDAAPAPASLATATAAAGSSAPAASAGTAAGSSNAAKSPEGGVRPTKAWRAADGGTAGQSAPATTGQAAAPDAAKLALKLKAAATKMKIQEIKSPGGISAWLVEEHSVPLLALRFVFAGGNSQDPAGKEGLANFLTAMMDEGAGELDASKFQERMEELAVRMSFEDARDSLYGNFETLSVNRDQAVEMLRLAINEPRFDADAMERIRKQLLANLAFAEKNPQQVAGKAWAKLAFPNHPYGRPSAGTKASVAAIQRSDIEGFRKRTFALDTLKVVAVGDISAKELGQLLDHVFGKLAAKAELAAVPQVEPVKAKKLEVVEMDVPQSVVQFGMQGLARKDPDFISAYVMNHILGGGGFSSRLTEQVREKRGLAYSVYSYLQPYRRSALFAGGVATKNEAVKESIEVIRAELSRMATEGPTETELANAKSYLTGSFALRFDTNSKIASQILWMLDEDMGIDYVSKRNPLIEGISLEDVKRAAKRILDGDNLLITVVGKPKGLGKS